MFRAFLLLITLSVVCMGSYFTYSRMDSKFYASEESIKQEMIKASHEMERKIKNEIQEGREPEELVQFRESWLERLQEINSLGNEKKGIERSFMSIIIPVILSFKFAMIEFFYVDEIAAFNGIYIYTSHIGWVFLLIACITIANTLRHMSKILNTSLEHSKAPISYIKIHRVHS